MWYKKTKIAVVDTKSWYNKAAKIYKTFHAWLASYDKGLYQRFLPRDLTDKVILDVWSGDARLHPYFADKGIKKYIGFDIADQLLKKAPSRVEKVVWDIEEPRRFEDNSIDVILCFFVFVHIRDIRHLLEESKRVLKDDGTIIILHNNQRRSYIYNLPSDTFKIQDYHWREADIENTIEEVWFWFDKVILEEDTVQIWTLYKLRN